MQIPQEDYHHCHNILTAVGISRCTSPEYREHFASNGLVMTLHNDAVFVIGQGIRYLRVGPDQDLGNGRKISGIRLQWRRDQLMYHPRDAPIDDSFLRSFLPDPRLQMPIGVIASTKERRQEFLSLGDVVEHDFCDMLTYQGRNLVHVYRVPDVPFFEPGQLQRTPNEIN